MKPLFATLRQTARNRLAAVLLTALVLGNWALDISAAVVTGTIVDTTGTALVTTVVFQPLSNPQADAGIVITAGPKSVTTGTNGTFSVTLEQGDYTVLIRGRDQFTIAVPNDATTNNVTTLTTDGLTYTYQPITSLYPYATALINGGVRTDTTESDPEVYTRGTVDTLIAGVATNTSVLTAITNQVTSVATALVGNKLDATNGAAVNLTGSLTNVTGYGATTLLPGNVTGRTNVVQVAPYQSATYAAGDFGPNSGETSFEFVNVGNAQRLRQTGTLQRVKVSIASTSGVTGFYVKVWRKVASNNYSLVGTSENLSSQLTAGIVDTLDLSTTIAAQLGDYVGVRVTYSSASARLFNSETPVNTSSTIYSISNATATDTYYAWESQTATADACVVLESYMTAPVLVAIGDSIMSGNSGSASLIETNGTYVAGIDIPDRIATGTRWSVQNMGYSGNRLVANILPRWTNDVLNSAPRIALLEGGVNDLRDGTSTASILAAYTTMLSNCVTAGIQPVLIGIMPFRTSSGTTDLMLTNRDTLNPQLQSAVEAVGGIYVNPDPYIGRFYPGGPQNNRWALDRDSDSGDGIHLSNIGRANIVRGVLEAMAPLTVRGGIVAGSVNAGAITVNGPIQFSTGAQQILTSARPTNSALVADFLYVQAQSAPQGSTNAAAGSLLLRSGAATGTGTGYVYVQTATPGSTGTSDTAWATRAEFSYSGTRIYTDATSFGSAATPDARFGVYYRGVMANASDSAGIYSLPQITVNSSSSIASVTAGMIANTALTKAVGFYAPEPAVSGGSFTSYFPLLVDLSTTPSNGAGLYIGTSIPTGFTGTYSLYSAVTNVAYLTGPLESASYLDIHGNNHAFGVSASPDARFGLYYRGAMASEVNNIGIYSLPEVSTNSAYAAAFAAGLRATGHLGATIGYYSPQPTEVSANVTNHFGVWAQTGTVADWSAGLFIGDTLPALAANYALYASSTLPALFAGQVQSLSAFASTGNAHALGAGASVDARFGLYLRPSISSSVNAYGIYSIPSVSGNAATTSASILSSVIVTQPTSGAAGNQVTVPVESGSGVLTNWFGMAIDTTPVADKTVGLYIGRGTPFTSTTNYAILSLETNSSALNGPLTILGNPAVTQPAVETLSYSGTNVTVTTGKGPLQRSQLNCLGDFNMLFTSGQQNDAGTIYVAPAATNCTVTLPAYAFGPTGRTLTISGGTGNTNFTKIAWECDVIGGTNRFAVNALNYY